MIVSANTIINFLIANLCILCYCTLLHNYYCCCYYYY